jgi:serralysin
LKILTKIINFRYTVALALVMGLAGSSCGPNKVEEQDSQIIAAGLVAHREKLWPNGSRIRVKFLNGSTSDKELVRSLANQWTRYANLHFDWIEEGQAEIRITFRGSGNYSTLGTDAYFRTDQSQDTMSLSGLGNDPLRKNKIILHEFGHAIGLQHEHLSPNSEIVLNRGKVTRECRFRYGLSPEVCEHAIFQTLEEDTVEAFEFDPHSVMNYYFHSSHYTENSPRTRIIGRLSLGDKLGISQLYPGRTQEETILLEQLEEDKTLEVSGKCRVLKDICSRGRYTVQYITIFGNQRNLDVCTTNFYEAVSIMVDESKCK